MFVDKLFVNKGVSGKHARRPELDKALAYLREGDVFVITRMSRAMRSLKHMIELAEQLRERGVDLVVIKQQLIVEGTNEGLAAARARGRTGGRRPSLTPALDRPRAAVCQPGADRGRDRGPIRRVPADHLPRARGRHGYCWRWRVKGSITSRPPT